MQWSQVAPSLLESLEMDRLRFPEIYERRAARYRLEPYRLKLCYVLEKLERTLARNNQLSEAGWQMPCEALADPKDGLGNAEVLHYTSVDQFRSDLELVRNSLVSTELSCEQLDTLLHQVHIFGFSLASLDIRQESTRHSDAIDELTRSLNCPRPMGTWTRRSGWHGCSPGTADPSPPDPACRQLVGSDGRDAGGVPNAATPPGGVRSADLQLLRDLHEPHGIGSAWRSCCWPRRRAWWTRPTNGPPCWWCRCSKPWRISNGPLR